MSEIVTAPEIRVSPIHHTGTASARNAARAAGPGTEPSLSTTAKRDAVAITAPEMNRRTDTGIGVGEGSSSLTGEARNRLQGRVQGRQNHWVMAIDGAVSAIVVWSCATAVWPPLSAWAACPPKSEAKARAIETTKNLGLRMIGTAFPLGVARRVHPGSQHPLMQTHVRQLAARVCHPRTRTVS